MRLLSTNCSNKYYLFVMNNFSFDEDNYIYILIVLILRYVEISNFCSNRSFIPLNLCIVLKMCSYIKSQVR